MKPTWAAWPVAAAWAVINERHEGMTMIHNRVWKEHTIFPRATIGRPTFANTGTVAAFSKASQKNAINQLANATGVVSYTVPVVTNRVKVPDFILRQS